MISIIDLRQRRVVKASLMGSKGLPYVCGKAGNMGSNGFCILKGSAESDESDINLVGCTRIGFWGVENALS